MKRELAARLAQAARQAADLRAASAPGDPAAIAVRALKTWQAARLAATHADLLAHPRYRGAARFFLDDLYEPRETRWRDVELVRVVPALGRYLPEIGLATLVEAVELDLLSEQLDLRLSQQLPAGLPIDQSSYARAYRAAGTPAERREQLALMLAVGQSLDRLVRKPFLNGLLTAMGPVAHAAGLQAIHGFLQRGFSAFRAMHGAQAFLELLAARETALMERLFAGAEDGLLEQGAGRL